MFNNKRIAQLEYELAGALDDIVSLRKQAERDRSYVDKNLNDVWTELESLILRTDALAEVAGTFFSLGVKDGKLEEMLFKNEGIVGMRLKKEKAKKSGGRK